MKSLKQYALLLSILWFSSAASAQDLTGTWQGSLGTYQFLQINMVQKGDKICGYTWDHLISDTKSFCKAYFEASFDKKSRLLTVFGTSFYANSGSHTLMELELSHKYVNDQEVLYYNPTTIEKIQAFINGETVETAIYLKKVSSKPMQMLPGINDCLNDVVTLQDTTKQFQVPEFPGDTSKTVVIPEAPKDTVATVIIPEKTKDTIAAVVPPENIVKDNLADPIDFEKRKNTEQSHIVVDVKTINLKVYDNAIMDGDTVSIYYNGKILLSHQQLSEKAIEINLELEDNQTRHEIILFAHNLGSIPPNTALVVITAGEKRYELFASASLEENAVLVFEYKPKE